MHARSIASLVLLSVLAAATTALGEARAPPAPNQAGVIQRADGKAVLVPNGAAPHPAKVGDIVSEGDVLASGPGGEIHVTMQDSGFLVVRPESRVRIVSYQADGAADDKGVLRLIAGGLRSITGWIGKYNPRGYKVQTAGATIGIRGTDHETRYIPEGSAEGEPSGM